MKGSGTYQIKGKRVVIEGVLKDTVKDTKDRETWSNIIFYKLEGKRFVRLIQVPPVTAGNDRPTRFTVRTDAKHKVYVVKRFFTLVGRDKVVVKSKKPVPIKKK